MAKTAVRTIGTVLALALCAVPSARAQASVDVVHAFAGLPGAPTSRLMQASNGLLYGTLREGGPMAAGVVFAAFVTPAGRLVPVPLHAFDGSDGRLPTAGLIQGSDGAFYGTTQAGGAADQGTVFRITSQGQFSSLHSFGGADGAAPVAELFQADDGGLYGTTTAGGTANQGTVFKITAAGDFTSVHSFTGADGANPFGPVLQATDGNFYGTTRNGGLGPGTVFRMTADGDVSLLYQFDAGSAGEFPMAGLIQGQDGALYGTTAGAGNQFPVASAFRITLSGDLTVLVDFFNTRLGPPVSGVIQGQDGALYGTAVADIDGSGAIYRIGADGALTTLHVFNFNDGAVPYGGLVQASDGTLYGLTAQGGAANRGTAYRITPAGVFTALYSFFGRGGDGPTGAVIRATDGNLYGTTEAGGIANRGTVFRLSVDGTLTTLHEFTGPDGMYPGTGVFQASNGVLYGFTEMGGAHRVGTVFAMTLGGTFVTVHSFTEAESFGVFGAGPLMQGRDGALYGLSGGFIGQPSVAFRITLGGVFTALATIQDASGVLIQGPDGNFYGTTSPSIPFNIFGGVQGSVFRMTPAGVVTTLAQFVCDDGFEGACPNGAMPAGGLVLSSDGALYGVTTLKDVGAQPGLFRVDGSGLHVIAPFEDGSLFSPLVQAADGRFYGTGAVGADSASAVYSVSAAGDFEIVHVFSPAEGSGLAGRLLETDPGVFYGTARAGGPASHGVVYRLTVPPGL